MKLCLYILKISNGGAERCAISIANHMANAGHEVDLVCSLKDDDMNLSDIDPKVNFIKLKDVEIKNIFTRFTSNIARKLELDKYFRQNKPDILFYMVYPFILNIVKFPKKMIVIGSDRGNPAEYTHRSYVRRRKKLLKRTDALIFQTERASNFFKDLDIKKTVIPNAIYNSSVYTADCNAEKENSICAAGRFVYEKDYPTLLKAFSLVQKKHPEVVLKIFGTGELKTEIEDLIASLNLVDSVKLMGRIKNVPEEIVKSKCYVLSSISEGMPNALIEAMAVGMPCVATDCPNGPAELIKNNENGLLVPIKSTELLAEAILKMLDDVEFAKKCGENAIKIRETNRIDIINDQYLNFIESVEKRK